MMTEATEPLTTQAPGRQTLAASAVDAIMNLIRAGELKPGATVNEVVLANRLGTSRGPIREAIRTLEGRKIVTRMAYQRARVAVLDRQQVREVFELREALEGMACRLATRCMSKEALDALAASPLVLDAGHNSLITAGTTSNFHSYIVQQSGNDRIQSVLNDGVYDLVRFYRWSSPPAKNVLSGQFHPHWQIVRAMQARDEDLAESLMRSHVRGVIERIDVD